MRTRRPDGLDLHLDLHLKLLDVMRRHGLARDARPAEIVSWIEMKLKEARRPRRGAE
jgi:hypothetical protein